MRYLARAVATLGCLGFGSSVSSVWAAPPKAPAGPVVLKAARMFDAERGAVTAWPVSLGDFPRG